MSILSEKRLKNWFGNVLRRFSFVKKNRNIWIFGAWNGEYKDNSKYMFEYVSRNYPEIKSYYYVSDDKSLKQIQKLGLNAVLIGSEKAKKIAKKAGVSFYTNGLDDFGDKVYNYNSIKVALWHGVGFKKIYYAEEKNCSLIKKFYRGLYSSVARDITITTSDFAKKVMTETFKIKDPNSIFIIGQPRNDLFFYERVMDNTVLYLPTYRQNENDNIYITQLLEYFYSDEFLKFLEENDLKLKIKLHPLTKKIKVVENARIIDASAEDTQILLTKAKCVISDYSSVIMDFAITKRNIVIYAPDYIEYCKNEGLYGESLELYKKGNIITSPNEVIGAIKDDKMLSTQINDLFNADLTGDYSKKIADVMKRHVGF